MKKLPLTFWVTDFEPSQVTIGFHSKIKPHFKMTIYPNDNLQKLTSFLNFIGRIINDDQHYYISFASRFFEMPLLVFINRHRSAEIVELVNQRQKFLTSLDSPFNAVNHHPQLWNDAEKELLSKWQHNAHFLDIRTLDGRIDHGELNRYERYLVQANLPLIKPGMALPSRIALKLSNLKLLFNRPELQLSWKQHLAVMAKYHSRITADPHEKWPGMMTIMPTTTDAETMEAILYRDRHIKDRPHITLPSPAELDFKQPWTKELAKFYQPYNGIDRHNPVALTQARLKNKHYRPPLISDRNGEHFALIPSEGGLHGFTVNQVAFKHTTNFQQANLFSNPNHAEKVIKIERPLINQEIMLSLGVFDDQAEPIVKQMITDVNQHYPSPTITSHLEQKLLHALKGASDTSFDNHLKQPNTILQVRLTSQLLMIKLCQELIQNGYRLLSVNSTLLYVAPTPRANKRLLNHLPDNFRVTDSGTHWFAKSPNDHVYLSKNGSYQLAGDNTNHFYGPNIRTDQQRPTITETVLVEYLMKAGLQSPINQQLIRQLLQKHLNNLTPQEWFQPILTSKLKQVFAIAYQNTQAIVANPVLKGFFVKDNNAWQIERLYGNNNSSVNDKWAQELATQVHLNQHFNLSKRYLSVERNQLFTGRRLFLSFSPADIQTEKLKACLDLDAYTEIVNSMLKTWIIKSQPKSPQGHRQLVLNI